MRGFTQARIGIVGFVQDRMRSLGQTSGRRVHSGLRGFTQAQLMVIWFIHVPVGCRIHLSSRGFTVVRLGVVWLIRVRVGSLGLT